MMPKLIGRLVGAAAAGALLFLSALASAGQAFAAAAPLDLSGFWELRDDSKHVSPAKLTPAYQKKAAEERAKTPPPPPGQTILGFASRWCHPLGTPFIMGDSAPIDIIQGAKETAITAEVQSAARHIYTDGRGHPDMAAFDPTTNGHSIGRWEGSTFVVDTVGFNERGNPGIPGGGARGPTSHLVERYEMSPDREQLKITFTWTDSNVFAEPHSYYFVYYKTPPETYAFEYFCDASDPARTAEVVAE
jgi:hypothetical protein